MCCIDFFFKQIRLSNVWTQYANIGSELMVISPDAMGLLIPKSETRGFDSWLTSSLRTECSFPLATSNIEMMSETKFYSYAEYEHNNWYWVIKSNINRYGKLFSLDVFGQDLNDTFSAVFFFFFFFCIIL